MTLPLSTDLIVDANAVWVVHLDHDGVPPPALLQLLLSPPLHSVVRAPGHSDHSAPGGATRYYIYSTALNWAFN